MRARRNTRPRDGLGRPLPYGSIGIDQLAEGVVRTPAETLAEASRLLATGRPFHAHEVLEDAWKAAPEADRALWRGLAQLAVGITHAARGNAVGAARLVERGAANIAPYSPDHPSAPSALAAAHPSPFGIDAPAAPTPAHPPVPGVDVPAAPTPAHPPAVGVDVAAVLAWATAALAEIGRTSPVELDRPPL